MAPATELKRRMSVLFAVTAVRPIVGALLYGWSMVAGVAVHVLAFTRLSWCAPISPLPIRHPRHTKAPPLSGAGVC